MKPIVLVDSGNTRLKVGLLWPGAVRAQGAPAPAPISVHAFGKNDVRALSDWLATLPEAPWTALGANVAGAERGLAIEAALAPHGCAMRWICAQAQAHGLTSRYATPEQLGADRWVSMLGVWAGLNAGAHAAATEAAPAGERGITRSAAAAGGKKNGFLLASFGTATTLDTVGPDGVFEGGLILPGPALMRQSLASGTAGLPLAQGSLQDFPTDTHRAIWSGVAAAQAGALLRQWLAGVRRYGQAPGVFAAGGAWNDVAAEIQRLLADTARALGHLPPTITPIENPVLDGLAYLAANINLGTP